MNALAWLIPISLVLGAAGLAAFLWSLRSGQFRDIEGDATRILLPDDPEPNLSARPADARQDAPRNARDQAINRPDPGRPSVVSGQGSCAGASKASTRRSR